MVAEKNTQSTFSNDNDPIQAQVGTVGDTNAHASCTTLTSVSQHQLIVGENIEPSCLRATTDRECKHFVGVLVLTKQRTHESVGRKCWRCVQCVRQDNSRRCDRFCWQWGKKPLSNATESKQERRRNEKNKQLLTFRNDKCLCDRKATSVGSLHCHCQIVASLTSVDERQCVPRKDGEFGNVTAAHQAERVLIAQIEIHCTQRANYCVGRGGWRDVSRAR